MKRIITCVFAFMLAGQAWAETTFTIGSLEYTVIGGTHVSVKAASNNITEANIPSEVTNPDNGVTYMVTSIGDNAFNECSSLTSVTIPESVKSIGHMAFNGCNYLETLTYNTNAIGSEFSRISSLKTINIGNSVTIIGNQAFLGCSGLTSITIPESVTSIGDGAFSGSGLTSLTIPESVTSIFGLPFRFCDNLETLTYNTNAIGGVIFGMPSLKTINIGDKVTEIPDNAFSECSSLTSVTIPESVTSIGDNAFGGCSSLTTVTIGNSVTSIGDHAFESCNRLTSVTIPESVTSIGDNAFLGCSSLTTVTIGNSVTSIGDNAFAFCSSMTSVTIPESVTSIGDHAFESCNRLTSVTIPESVTSIGESAFTSCDNLKTLTYNTNAIGSQFMGTGSLKTINIGDKVTRIADNAFNSCGLTSITIPNSVTSIGEQAFAYCFDMTSVTFQEGSQLESIGNEAFAYCELNSLDIPESVTTIGDNAFGGIETIIYSGTAEGAPWGANIIEGNSGGGGSFEVDNLLYIIIDEDKHYVSVGQGSEPATGKVDIPSYVTNPDDGIEYEVTAIGDNAFSNCSNLTSISIPDVVTTIGHDAFSNCINLNTVTIPNSITSIGDRAFAYCYDMKSVTFDEGSQLESIGDEAFAYCGLSSLDIPESVTTIGDNAFGGIETIIYSGTAEGAPWGANEVNGNSGGGGGSGNDDYFYVDNLKYTIIDEVKHYVSVGQSSIPATGNVNIPPYVTNPDDGIGYEVTEIGESAFNGCYNLTSISIPDGVTTIGNDAFGNCSSLTTINIPDGVTSIGRHAFMDCRSLTSITIPEGVTRISYAMFENCSSLISITMGNDVTSIDTRAFMGCSSLTDITIPEGVTEIGADAFHDCSDLTSINIPNGVTSFGQHTFDGCSSLTSITLPDGFTSIGMRSFKDCSSLTSINIPDGITEIETSTFEGCAALTNITIGNGVKMIGYKAFADCSNLTSLTLPDDITYIEEDAFSGCTGLSINIPEGVSFIGENAFGGVKNIIYSGDAFGQPWGANTCGILQDENGFVYADEEKTQLVAYLGNASNITIPESVIYIGDNAFYDCAVLTSVEIPNSVTNIGDGAFNGCSGVKTLVYNTNAVNNAVSSTANNYEDWWMYGDDYYINNNSIFSEMTALETVNIGNAVTSIGDNLFSGLSSIKTINIGGSVASIGNSAFRDCSGLTTIEIPNSITSIGNSAFFNCRNLASITLPNTLASIGQGAFGGCAITSITIPESVATIGNFAFGTRDGGLYNENGSLIEIIDECISEVCPIETLTYNTNAIGTIFRGIESLKTVNIGNSVTVVARGAFANCSGLTSITIPEAVTYVGDYAFGGCNNLTSIFIESNADISNAGLAFTKDDIRYNVLSKNSAKLVSGADRTGEFVIPEKVTAGNTFTIMGIGEGAFSGNSGLTSLTIPEWVTNIGYGAFSGCSNLVTLTYNTDAVGTMFSGYQSLKTVNIGDAVTRLEDGAFAGCKYLENVSVGNGIESVGNNVFAGCNFLDYNIYSNGYYLGNSQNPNMILMSARNKNITSCTVSADCRFICDGAFKDCKKLAEVVLPESLTYVNNEMFAGCSSLKSVAIPESVTAIGDNAFKGCSSLAEIEIPESVTTIGSSAFEGCSGITTLTIPNGVTSVSNNAFDGCTGLESVVIGKSVAEFSSGIFANCNGLNSIICYAETPIRLEDDPFIFNDTIYVPATSVDAYKSALIWKRKDIMPFYQVKVLSANQLMGTAEGDSLQLGDHAVTLTATPADGYHFERWSDGKGQFQDAEITVLIDEFTASSSEIFAGALQDNDRGLIVGCRSYGKGLVQKEFILPDSSAVRLTTARYYTPSGRCIQKEFNRNNMDDYSNELVERFKHGEMDHRDSIKVDKSQMYTTAHGRTVYGGGGIVPDIFVPRDTSGMNRYYIDVNNAGLLQRYAFTYCDNNRTSLKKMSDYKQFLRMAPTDDALIEDFADFAAQNGIPPRWYYINMSRDLIVTQLKAMIARDIFGSQAYYPILNRNDKTVQQALKAMNKHKAVFPITESLDPKSIALQPRNLFAEIMKRWRL